jgi:hypothetical protein
MSIETTTTSANSPTTSKKNNINMSVDEDECDSSFVLKMRKPVKIVSDSSINQEEPEENDTSALITKSQVKPILPPIKTQKSPNFTPPLIAHAKTSPPLKQVQVRPVGKSPNRKIDKIADNLKINILQKEKNLQQAPKVSLLLASSPPLNKLKESSPNRLNQNVLDTKSLAKSYHKILLENLKKNEKENQNNFDDNSLTSNADEDDDDEDLTDLNWLIKFNLASTGLRPISPPLTPPKTSVAIHTKIPSIRLAKPALTKPILNPLIVKRVPSLSLSCEDDEADGCGQIRSPTKNIKQSHFQNDISSLIKPWLPVLSPKSQKDAKTVNNHQQRPPYSFSCLTFMAIESSQRKRLSVKEIYHWVIEHFPYYQSVPSGSWKNSIRHNLSYNNCFAKVDKNLLAMRDFSGKGSLWCINPEYRPLLIESLLKTPTHEQHKICQIPLLQDVIESPRHNLNCITTNGSIITTSSGTSIRSNTSSSSSNSSLNNQIKSFSASQQHQSKFNTSNNTRM